MKPENIKTDALAAHLVNADFPTSESRTQLVFEQYTLCLEMADKISERRQAANSYFLGINTGLCALIGYVYSKDVQPDLRPLVFLVPVAGFLLSYFWYRVVKSHRDLNGAKFLVIQEMERHLPLAPYRSEWKALGEGRESHRYTPFSHLEIWVPRIFIGMYALLTVFLIAQALGWFGSITPPPAAAVPAGP